MNWPNIQMDKEPLLNVWKPPFRTILSMLATIVPFVSKRSSSSHHIALNYAWETQCCHNGEHVTIYLYEPKPATDRRMLCNSKRKPRPEMSTCFSRVTVRVVPEAQENQEQAQKKHKMETGPMRRNTISRPRTQGQTRERRRYKTTPDTLQANHDRHQSQK